MAMNGILIVEDDEIIRESIRMLLELEGYAATCAANGQEALEQLKTMPQPCLILLDLMMPVMNGWEFVHALDRDSTLATIPVVVVTAFSEKAGEMKSRLIIKKPVDTGILLRVVHQHCGPPEARKGT
jgi:CheY-like chemotaxis protein